MATCKMYPLIKSSSTSFFLTGPFKYELCNDFSLLLGTNLASYLYFTSSIDTVDSILSKGFYLQGIPASSLWLRIVVA